MSIVSDVEDLAVAGINMLLEKQLGPGALIDAIHSVTQVALAARAGTVKVEDAATEIRKLVDGLASNDAVVDKEIDGGS